MSILAGLGTIANIAKEANRLDLYQQVVELMKEVGEQADENYRLRKEISEFRERESIAAVMKVTAGAYFVPGRKPVAGPYCTRCWDVDEKLVLMQPTGSYNEYQRTVVNRCPQCKSLNAIAERPPTSPTVNV